MSQQLNYGKTPVVPFQAKEGDISIVKTQTAAGTISGPSVASPLSAGNLREVGIETIFKKIITLTGKTSENITAKKYLVFHSDGTVKLSASSGSTATNMVALSDQDSNDKVVVGIL